MPKLPVSVKGFLFVGLLFTLFLKLSEMFSDALFFGRFLGWFFLLFEFQIVFPYLTLVAFHNTLHFTVGCHKCLNIGISEIEPKEVKWLWYPYIPSGKVTLLQGDPGDGKSKLMLSIAALLSKGEALPFTEEEIEPMTDASGVERKNDTMTLWINTCCLP